MYFSQLAPAARLESQLSKQMWGWSLHLSLKLGEGGPRDESKVGKGIMYDSCICAARVALFCMGPACLACSETDVLLCSTGATEPRQPSLLGNY